MRRHNNPFGAILRPNALSTIALLISALTISALSIIALGAGCSPKPDQGAAVAPPASGERLTVEPRTIADLRPVSGEYATRDQADARARISGTLVELKVKEGDTVKRGQVIGVIRDDRIGLQTSALDAQTAAAAAQAARADADLARTKDLYEHGVYAKARLDQVEAEAKATRAQLAAAKAQSAASANLAHQGEVLAPASGLVLHAQVPAGSVVMPGQSIATITAGPAVIRLELPEAQTGAIKVGEAVAISTNGGAASTQVLQIYPAVTAGEITLDLAAPKEATGLIGSRVDVSVPVGQRMAIAVPGRFLTHRYGVDYVRVLKRDGTANEVVVQTGASQVGGETEILSGLGAGDVILGPGAAR